MEYATIAFQELQSLSPVSWGLLVAGLAFLYALMRLARWLYRLARRASGTSKIAFTGFHGSVEDNEVAILRDIRESIGVSSGEAVVLRWRPSGKSALELKLKVTDRFQRRGIFANPYTVALSENNYARIQEHFDHQSDEPIESTVAISNGWWPGDHPDPSIRMGFWITIWITFITTFTAVIIEIAIP